MPRDIQKDLTTAEDIDENGVYVTGWEASFLDNVLKTLEAGRPLTERQGNILEQIHERRVK